LFAEIAYHKTLTESKVGKIKNPDSVTHDHDPAQAQHMRTVPGKVFDQLSGPRKEHVQSGLITEGFKLRCKKRIDDAD
jgi:hypothetical protein